MALTPAEIDRRSGATDPARERHIRDVDAYIARTPVSPAESAMDVAGVRNSDDVVRNRTYSGPAAAPAGPAPAAAPAPSGPGAGGGGGGAGGGGGGSSMSGSLASDLAGLDAELEAERKRLAGQFTLAESDQEREALARSMSALERRYEESKVMLANAYERGRTEVGGYRSEAEARRERQMLEVMDAFERSASELGEIDLVTEGRDAVYGVGAGLGTQQGGSAYAAEIAELAGVEGALSSELAGAHSSDLDWIANLLSLEEAAAAGDLERGTADREGGMQAEHARRVAERIQEERALLATLDQELLGRFMGRRGDLESMIMQESQFARSQAAAARRAASSGGSGDDGDGASGNLSLERELGRQMIDEMLGNGANPSEVMYRARANGWDMDYARLAANGDTRTSMARTADDVMLNTAMRFRSGR